MAKVNKINTGMDIGKGKDLLLVGVQTCTVTTEINEEVPQKKKLKINAPYDPSISLMGTDTSSFMVIASLFTISRKGK